VSDAPVQLFHTCLVNEFAPEVGLAVVDVLERSGARVEVPPDQTCCGQPAYNAGFHDEARAVARRTIVLLEKTEGAIVVPSGSCADMLVHQYPLLFEGDADWEPRARALAARCREFSQYLAERGPAAGDLQARVAYHPSCHLQRGLGVREQPLRLLGAVKGVTVVPLADADECCGFGGLFAIGHAEISGSVMDRKLDAVEKSGAERLVSCDLGCLLHLGGGLHRRGSRVKVEHLAQVLDESQR
jgi:L-lactate dehydrogenase complex protein LldE